MQDCASIISAEASCASTCIETLSGASETMIDEDSGASLSVGHAWVRMLAAR